MIKFLFFFSFFLILYSYAGYGILLYVLLRLKKWFSRSAQPGPIPALEPDVTLIVPAFNEAGFIREKIRNCLELDYPADKLRLIFISDGSNDGTADIIREENRIILMHEQVRLGKLNAMNRAMKTVTTPFVVFSDANTLLNPEALKRMMRHYTDPRIGGVTGEKRILAESKGRASIAGEGIYWKYESWLKRLDSDWNTVIGAAGELFSLRTILYKDPGQGIIIEDFVLSMQVCLQGFLIRYEPGAVATESASLSIKEEQKRKIRIAAGAFQAMSLLSGLFNVFRYPALSFQFISHRMLRWTFCPLCLVVLAVTNTILFWQGAGGLYTVFFLAQIVFYAVALLGWIFANRNVRIRAFYLPYYFLFMNLAVFAGFFRWLSGKQPAVWEKARRHTFT